MCNVSMCNECFETHQLEHEAVDYPMHKQLCNIAARTNANYNLISGLQINRVIGEGAYGCVFAGTYRGDKVAVKLSVLAPVEMLDDETYFDESMNQAWIKDALKAHDKEYEIARDVSAPLGRFAIAPIAKFENLTKGTLPKHVADLISKNCEKLHMKMDRKPAYDAFFISVWELGTPLSELSNKYPLRDYIFGILHLYQKTRSIQFLHNDLKPDNIVFKRITDPLVTLDDGRQYMPPYGMVPTFIDFGFSSDSTHKPKAPWDVTQAYGTIVYTPPEGILLGLVYVKQDTLGSFVHFKNIAQEIFSIGCIMISNTVPSFWNQLIDFITEDDKLVEASRIIRSMILPYQRDPFYKLSYSTLHHTMLCIGWYGFNYHLNNKQFPQINGRKSKPGRVLKIFEKHVNIINEFVIKHDVGLNLYTLLQDKWKLNPTKLDFLSETIAWYPSMRSTIDDLMKHPYMDTIFNMDPIFNTIESRYSDGFVNYTKNDYIEYTHVIE